MAFPQTLTVDGTTWNRESCSDGWVYRVTGINNPHVTIHGVSDDFYWWKSSSGEFHLRYSSAGSLWEFKRGEPYRAPRAWSVPEGDPLQAPNQMVRFPGGDVEIGTHDRRAAYDNERLVSKTG